MKDKDLIPQENPAITRILELIDALFMETSIDGNYFRIPQELRPLKKEISTREANDLILLSLDSVRGEIRLLVSQLAKIDPDFFDARLAIFLDEWPKHHSGENLLFFWTLKFYIEAQAEMILSGLQRD